MERIASKPSGSTRRRFDSEHNPRLQIKPALDEMGQREGASLDELITRAIEEYLFAHRFRLLRERMSSRAQEQGIYTDQDVFERVS
jgi:hypothetical protein